MYKALDKNKKIVLYGAGEIAHNIYRALAMSGYTIAYCVVTNDKVKESEFEEVKVYSFIEKKTEIIKEEYQIVIATLLRFEIEIVGNLKKNGITEFWKTTELPWNCSFEKYSNLDREAYREIIKRKYFSNKGKYEKDVYIRNYIEKNKKKKINEKKITFLLLSGKPRVYKIIEALHRKGYIIELLVWINAICFTKERYQEFERISNESRVCTDIEEVMLYCATTDSKILHIFSDASSDIEVPQSVIRSKNKFDSFPTVIFDEYDVITGINQAAIQKTMDAELFCLANADGLCNRYRNMEFLEDQGYDICKKRIWFGDCCNDFTQYKSPQRREGDELHLVFVGTLFGDEMYQRIRAGKYLDFAVRCKEHKTHLHLYPISYDEAKLQSYINMEKENPYFHLHQPILSVKLAQELNQYDFGFLSAIKDFLGNKDENGIHEREDYIYAEANKFYDYLDAGLPIVAAAPVKQTEMLEQDGVLIRKIDEEVDFDELRKRRNEMKKKVVEVREKYRISKQLPRLIEFYESF